MAECNIAKLMLCMSAAIFIKASNITVVSYRGSSTNITCDIQFYTYPEWTGPPGQTFYNYQRMPTLNSDGLGEKYSRLAWNTNKRDLILSNIKLTDAGIYRCQGGKVHYYIHLIIRVLPNPPDILDTDIIGTRRVVHGTEDQTVTFTCVSRNGYPTPYLDWYRNDINITSTRNLSIAADLTNVTITSRFVAKRSNDRVTLICESSYDQPDTPLTTAVILYLSLKPSTVEISGSLSGIEGMTIQIKCTAKECRPQANISWSFDGNIFTPRVQSTLNQTSETYTLISDFIVGNLTRDDNGKRVDCNVTHKALQSEHAIIRNLDVQFTPKAVNLTGNTIIIADGTNKLTLTCTTTSANPVANITWTHKGVGLTTVAEDMQSDGEYGGKIRQQDLTITPTRYMDGDAISCAAEHYLLEQSQRPTQQISLDLRYKPNVTIQEGESVSYTEGQTKIELHCGASSKPKSTFRWFHNNTVVSASQAVVETNELIHMIEDVDRTHYGEYKCEANNTIASDIDTIYITVEFKPLQVRISGNKVTEANGVNQLELTCETGTANPKATIVWLNDTVLLSNTGHINTSETVDDGQYGGKVTKQILVLVPTRFMDGSKIVCNGWNNINSNNPVSTVATLDINYEPLTTISIGKEKTVTEGQTNVKLTCSAESKPPSSFSWFKIGSNNFLMSGNGTISDNSFDFTISSVNRTHTGEYMCMARNEIGVPHNSSIHLNVHYPPDVTVTTTNMTMNATSIDIDCVAAGVPSNYIFYPWQQTWLGTTVTIRDQLSPRSTGQPSKQKLMIQSPSYQDTGVYTCFVENGINVWNTDVRNKTGSVYLLVKSYPVVTRSVIDVDEHDEITHKVSAQLNNKFTVNISFYSNAGDIEHKFYKLYNNTKVEVNDSVKVMSMADVILKVYETDVTTQGHTLTISHTIKAEDQFGSFYVDILNEMGIATVPLEIIPAGPPCTPEHVKIDVRSETTIRLSWIRCFHGGFAQTFLVQYSEDGLSWTNGSFTEGGLSTSRARLNTTVSSLTPGTLYYLRVLAFNEQGISNCSTVLNKTTEKEEFESYRHQEENPAAAISGGVLSVVALLVVILVVIVYRKRIRQKIFKTSDQSLIQFGDKGKTSQRPIRPISIGVNKHLVHDVEETCLDTKEQPVLPCVQNEGKVYLHNLWDYIKMTSNNYFEKLHQEYWNLPTGLAHECIEATRAYNSKKNRYRDMIAYDHSRVILDRGNMNESNYINANYIDGYTRQNKFIASQGPTEAMVGDFWDMILQENSSVIVMLTNLVENGAKKCIQYWPNDGEDDTFGNITISSSKSTTFPDYVIRELDIAKAGEMPKRIIQIHFTAWPDKNVPTTAWHLVNFWRKVNTLSGIKSAPIIVHCSAGVGRTGTYIALDNLYTQAKTEGYIQPFEIVNKMRKQRVNMVQTKEQYVFLHEALAEALFLGMKPLKPSEYAAVFSSLLQTDRTTGKTGLEEQFQWITGGTDDGDIDHEYSNLLPTKEIDEYRPKRVVAAPANPASDDALHVCYVQNYTQKDIFLVTNSPGKQSMDHLWTVILKHNIRTIINLNNATGQTKGVVIDDSDPPENDSEVHVKRLETKCGEQFSEKIFSMKQDSGDSTKTVKEFVFHSWKEGATIPNGTTSVIALLNAVQSWQPFVYEAQPILIHCESGFDRSGLVCVLLAEFERIRIEEEANILETVKRIKDRNPQMIQYFEQYKFCYSAVLDYIRQFDVYMNV